MKNILIVVCCCFPAGSLLGQGEIEWERNYGGSGRDEARSIQQTADGGYIAAGYTDSNDGDVGGNNGEEDYWVIRLNADGDLLWERSYGGSGNEQASSVQQTADGGYIVAGDTRSTDGDVGGNNGSFDFWVIRLNADGDILWERNYGGSGSEAARSIQQTADGGYIVAGHTQSNDGDVGGNSGSIDFWVIRLNADGDLLWEQNYGGTGPDIAHSIQQTTDGGYVVAGDTESNNGDVSGNNGFWDYWVIRLNADGDLLWERSYGGSDNDVAHSIQQTADGGYIVAGDTRSNNGDVGGNNGASDFWVIRLKPCPVYSSTKDTIVCSGQVSVSPDTLLTAFGCDSIITYNIISLPDAFATQDFTICTPDAALTAQAPSAPITGQWTVSNTEALVINPTFNQTAVSELRPGENTFVWTLSHPDCPSYSQDTLTVFYEDGWIEASNDEYVLSPSGGTVTGNVADNDEYPDLAPIVVTEINSENEEIGNLNLTPQGQFEFELPGPTNVLYRAFTYRVAHESCPQVFDEARAVLRFTDSAIGNTDEEENSFVFTPNGDGVNDTFIIPELEENPQEFPRNSLAVIDRWGNVVYEASPYNNDWDGTHYRTGKPLPPGTYFYVARLSVVEGIVKRERVTLIR